MCGVSGEKVSPCVADARIWLTAQFRLIQQLDVTA
jgi:hypothetical protein